MRIISFNANGLRSAASKGFFDWFAQAGCRRAVPAGNQGAGTPAVRRRVPPGRLPGLVQGRITKKGYSGVAIYSRREPDDVRTSLGWAPFDDEGRYIEARFGNLSVVSFYIPSGSPASCARASSSR
jgi:exodeoxyribonuclease-3